MSWNKQIGRASASECVSRRPRSPLARGNGELPLPKPVNSAILAAKPPESGECRFIHITSWVGDVSLTFGCGQKC